jgi:hypothetical protein
VGPRAARFARAGGAAASRTTSAGGGGGGSGSVAVAAGMATAAVLALAPGGSGCSCCWPNPLDEAALTNATGERSTNCVPLLVLVRPPGRCAGVGAGVGALRLPLPSRPSSSPSSDPEPRLASLGAASKRLATVEARGSLDMPAPSTSSSSDSVDAVVMESAACTSAAAAASAGAAGAASAGPKWPRAAKSSSAAANPRGIKLAAPGLVNTRGLTYNTSPEGVHGGSSVLSDDEKGCRTDSRPRSVGVGGHAACAPPSTPDSFRTTSARIFAIAAAGTLSSDVALLPLAVGASCKVGVAVLRGLVSTLPLSALLPAPVAARPPPVVLDGCSTTPLCDGFEGTSLIVLAALEETRPILISVRRSADGASVRREWAVVECGRGRRRAADREPGLLSPLSSCPPPRCWCCLVRACRCSKAHCAHSRSNTRRAL